MNTRSAVKGAVLGVLIAASGCRTPTHGPTTPSPRTPAEGVPAPPATVATARDAAAPAPAPTAAPGEKVLVVENGREKMIDAAGAVAQGYTLIDLSDDWTPFIFAEQRAAETGELLANRYRRVFIGLANDQLDEDGQPLSPAEKNYLELYGIFPSLSVLRARFLDDEGRRCQDAHDLAALEEVETVAYIPPNRVRAEARKLAKLRAELEKARRRAGVLTLAELAEKEPKQAPRIKTLEKRDAEKKAMTEVERRLTCEGLLTPASKHIAGVYDDPMKLAVKRFQQKHMIYESHYLRRGTMDALARAPMVNNHNSLLRVLRERAVEAAGVIEDGSISGRNAPRNLADELGKAVAEQLGVTTPEAAMAFFKRHGPGDFKRLRAAVKLPALPEYYGPQMNLSIVVDRGDVWYELPWDENEVRKSQPRKKYPSFIVLVEHGGRKIPLVKWRTTIGGWRAEQASDGYEYFRYKGSDVGPRVMRQIVAGPVWIAPASTPIRSLTKVKKIGKHFERVVNYSELGPSYLSAYGLVAGYFVSPGKNGRPDWDNGIRAHGSAEYLSMYSPNGYSHGCHRLPNHLAIRLYDFLLRRRSMRVVGDQSMNFVRQFLVKNDVFELRIPSRGYAYIMDPPVPIDVLEGEIKGEAKEPIKTYVPKPGVRYPGPPPAVSDSPEARAGGAPAASSKRGTKTAPVDDEEDR